MTDDMQEYKAGNQTVRTSYTPEQHQSESPRDQSDAAVKQEINRRNRQRQTEQMHEQHERRAPEREEREHREHERAETMAQRNREIAERKRIHYERERAAEERAAKDAMDRGAKQTKRKEAEDTDRKVRDRLEREDRESRNEEAKKRAKREVAEERAKEMQEKLKRRPAKLSRMERLPLETKHVIGDAWSGLKGQASASFTDFMNPKSPASTKNKRAAKREDILASGGSLGMMDNFWAKPPSRSPRRRAPSGLLDSIGGVAPSRPSSFLWGAKPKPPAKKRKPKKRYTQEPERGRDPWDLLL